MKIETKFDIGQKVWVVFDRMCLGERLISVNSDTVLKITVGENVKYRLAHLVNYNDIEDYDFPEECIFATKEEAEAKLKEMKGE